MVYRLFWSESDLQIVCSGLNQELNCWFGSVSHRKTSNQTRIYQLKSCDITLSADWSDSNSKQEVVSIKVNQSNKDECGSFPVIASSDP
ncbi:hypothetical protein LDENG_00175370 [Lucifuga dentata]|nr:hypothetical protein LDENG_00175370 [Lucifuga dentata]